MNEEKYSLSNRNRAEFDFFELSARTAHSVHAKEFNIMNN